MNTEIFGQSYLTKLGMTDSSQMGRSNQGLSAMSVAQYNWLKRLHQRPDIAVAVHNAVSLSQPSGTQMPNHNPEQNDPYAKYVDPASVRAAKKYLPGAGFEGKIE
jgi:hypothetical protein